MFSSDVIAAKGALAEDLANGEYTFPILVALYSTPPIREAIEGALSGNGELGRRFQERVGKATMMLQKDKVRGYCLTELGELREQNEEFVSLWGRKEEMVVADFSGVAIEQDMGVGIFGFMWMVLNSVRKYRLL